jgi:hypothetical protein
MLCQAAVARTVKSARGSLCEPKTVAFDAEE